MQLDIFINIIPTTLNIY